MIYLNNSATSFPKPKEVIESVTSYLNTIPCNPHRSGNKSVSRNSMEVCRENIALLFNIKDTNRIIFTSGATESLNLAIKGLDLNNKHVITTAIEHNSVLRPLKTLERDNIIDLTIIDCNDEGSINPDSIKKAIKDNTAAIFINHCSNVTGSITDLNAIGNIVKNNNILFIVDASQSAGIIPVDVLNNYIDMLVFTGHKSLYGMQGIGGIYIKENIDLKPLKIGGTGIKSDLLYQPEEMPLYYEAGTPNLPGIISLKSGIDFILATTIKEIYKKSLYFFNKVLKELQTLSNIIVYGPKTITERSPSIISFNIKNFSPEEICYILENSFNIIVRSGLHCAPLIHKAIGSYPKGSVRVSWSYFTTEKEIDLFLESIKEICNAKDLF